ncbi:MAG: hypothetical protein HY332_21485 [Chloroflexi bacterium]|nr:hypothetical protein [Chloroflexota bacterium]
MQAEPAALRTPEELVEIGFARSRVVMLNEAHSWWNRCLRTRAVGRRVLPVAYRADARYLAMEALAAEQAHEANRTRRAPEGEPARLGYLGQPEMRRLVQDALDLGFELVPYEAAAEETRSPGDDPMSLEVTNRREAVQARNLVRALAARPPDAKLLVWCGNGHLRKAPGTRWSPMATGSASRAASTRSSSIRPGPSSSRASRPAPERPFRNSETGMRHSCSHWAGRRAG